MPARDGPGLPGLYFAISSLCFLFSVGLVWYAYVGNVPVWTSNDPGVGYLDKAGWLLTVQDRFEEGGPGWKFGFGVWGWCEWHSGQDGVGQCHGKGSWSIPRSAPDGDPVLDLDLPGAVATSMFGCGVIVIIAAIISLIFFVVHFLTMRYEEVTPPPLFFLRSNEPKPKFSDSTNRRARLALILGWNWVLGVTLYLLFLVSTVPALAVSWSAKDHYGDDTTYKAEIGQGAWALLASVLLTFAGLITIYTGGLWPRKGLVKADGKVVKDEKKYKL
ncbi:hypothetical protein BD324DRAFT_633712 [Kockovaella imperatae]|uniref:SUR7/PalI family-domain-containing protein n=1 Tax=Kockovaella imperatae TaxID=4999 RepID=A0A1Y1UAI4_9TREE|nr:hypothetical protein BD324DRAFT_633712 [Kockovaella imperatae]ORX35040.1 hypothetical protein BD324DRAFT_633712 [Kockovaella imperatae]